MTGIIEYFIALASTALIGMTVMTLIKDDGIRRVIRTMIGVLLLLVIIKPISAINIDTLAKEIGDSFHEEFRVSDYESLYRDKLRLQVQTTTEDYIRKKAESMGATLFIKVEVSDDTYPTPEKVYLSGVIGGEQRSALQEYLTQDLGIPVDKQRWDLYD